MHPMHPARLLPARACVVASAMLAAALGHTPAATAVDRWWPVEVDVWTPPFNKSLLRERERYEALEGASKPWRICVSIPHLQDAYWLGVNHGLVEEARRQGVALDLHQAGGYEFMDVQRAQIEACLADGSDGLIVSAVSRDGVNDLVARADGKGIPVVDLINGMSSPRITARAAPSYWINANVTGTYLRQLQAEGGVPIQVAWFPGPAAAAWVRDADAGFRAAVSDAPITIVTTRHGDTGRSAQRPLVEAALDEHGNELDYIVGTAPTAEAAASVLRSRGLADRIKVLAFYFSPGVYRGIRRGSIVAAPADGQGLVSRIAVDIMVRALQNEPYVKHLAPVATMVDAANVRVWDPWATLAPRGFRPVFRVNAP